MDKTQFFHQIRQHIAAGDLQKALGQLRLLLENTTHLNDALQQSGRLASIQQQFGLGLASHAEAPPLWCT